MPDVTQNRSDAAEYQAIPEQSPKIADAASPEATNLALPHQSFARGSLVRPKLPGAADPLISHFSGLLTQFGFSRA